MTVRVHRSTWGTYWRWTCDTCDLWDSAGDWDEAMEAATGHAVYRHARAHDAWTHPRVQRPAWREWIAGIQTADSNPWNPA